MRYAISRTPLLAWHGTVLRWDQRERAPQPLVSFGWLNLAKGVCLAYAAARAASIRPITTLPSSLRVARGPATEL